MAYGDITNKLESAAYTHYVANPVSGLTGYRGQDDATRALPSVVFEAVRGEELVQASGNFTVELTARVESCGPDNDLGEHRAFFAGVVDLFTDSAIAANLSAASSDFFVFGVRNPRFNESIENRSFRSELSIDCIACGSDLN